MKLGNIKISPINIEERKKFDGKAGDTVRVSVRIKEGDKTRTQDFEGLIISRKHGTEAGGTFTVRKIASGVGVERTFPLYSPNIEKLVIKKRGRVRRAKLYFIHDKASKEIRKKMRSEVVKEVVSSESKTEETKSE
jgi:large subunit ribosomal protein L19